MSRKLFHTIFILILITGLVITERTPVVRAAGPWYVSPSGDDSNDCLSPTSPCATINGAIGKASSGETVNIAEGTYNGTGSEVVLIDRDITLLGGWDAGFSTQSGMSTIDGERARRGVTVNSGVMVMLQRFAVQNGFSGADFNGGGGIRNDGNLTVNHSMVSHNTVAGYNGAGGGIYNNFGTVILNNSSVSSNRIGTHSGGGIYNNFGTMTLNNSTVSNNTAGTGAGIDNNGTLTLNSSTISHNTAFAVGGIAQNGGSTILQNSIVAGNTGVWPDCIFSPTSAGYNIIGDATSCNFSPTTGDQINLDPNIGSLMGSPGYQPLLSDSPAIEAGNPAGCMGSDGLLTTDQRGAARTGICDIGAYEYTPPGAASSLFMVNGDGQQTAPAFAFSKPLQVAALDSLGSPVSGIEVTFTAPVTGASGTFSDTGTNTTSVLTNVGGVATASTFTANDQFGAYTVSASASGIGSVDFNMTNAVWYVAPTGDDSSDCSSAGSPCATINGALVKAGSGDAVFVAEGTYVSSGTEVVFINKDILLLGGWDATFTSQNSTSVIDGQGQRLGVQIDYFTTATIERFTVQNGSAGAVGGVWNNGTLTVNASTIKGNTGLGDGGGVLNLGILTINNSSIIDNTGGNGGGIQNGSGGSAFLATANINNSTISGNSASSRGGGIGNESTGTLTLNNTTVSGNQDAFFPGSGGLYNRNGNVTLQNSIVAGNHNTGGGASDCNGMILSSGYNLIGNTFDCTFTSTTGDLTDIDPNLGRLIGSAGAPSYHPLPAGSQAIDAGNPSGCTDQDGNLLPNDQRGVGRVGACDIGAYEFTTPGPAANLSVTGGDNQSGATTFAFPEPLQAAALDSQGSPVGGVTVDFAAPASGPSGTFADTNTNTTSAVTEEDGIATADVFTANDQPGTYIVTASASGLGSVEFNLEQISRPLNDNLNNAKPIPSLPFNDSLDSTNATMEPGESSFCGSTPETQSVWYLFTPAADVVVRVDMFGSSFSDANLTVFQQVGPGFEGLSFLNTACFGSSVTFTAQAGTNYYLQAQSYSSGGGDLHVNLHEVSPPANDNFADAEPIPSLPFSVTVDGAGATTEPGEPQVCTSMDKTVWYTFTPTATMHVRADSQGGTSANVNVYRAAGSAIQDLQFLGCASPGSQVNFLAEAEQVYYIQAGPAFGGTGMVQVNLTEVIAITGRVTDAVTSAPLPGNAPPFAFVTLRRVCGDGCLEIVGSQNADSEGRFLFDNYFGNPLPTGSYQIEVSANLYQREQFGPFEFSGASLDVGDLAMDAVALIGSIRGRLIDAATGKPVSTTFTPSVQLYRCTDGNCFEFVNSQAPDSQGRFRFETDSGGNPLTVGTYRVVASADQYQEAQTETFDVGAGMHRNVGNLRITSFPVRFSDIQPCANLPASGGECSYSVRVWNGLSTRLIGDAWSVVNATLPDSFAGVTDFEIKELQFLNLEKGRSKVFRFRFTVPATSSLADGFICTRLFVGQGLNFRFNTIGFRDLFCIFQSPGGFSIASPQETMALAQERVTAASTGTEIEPNNSCQTAQDVGAVPLPYVLDGNLDSSAGPDIDFYRFSGTAGTLITVDHEGQSTGKGTLGNPFVGVFDSNCNLMDLNDDFNSLNSHLEITVPSDGVFILGATVCCDSGFTGGGEGSYQLSVAPVQLIGSITGRLTNAISGTPLRGDVEPFAFVRLLQCGDFGCADVNSQAADSAGRFLFTSDSGGAPLRVGNYQIVVSANQYMAGQTEIFTVGEADHYDVGDFALTPFPVVFSEIQPCSIPSEGGLCNYSVKITNGLATRLSGKAWSVASGSGTGSFAGLTVFQTDLGRELRLDPGQTTTLRFRFRVPGSVADGATICALAYVGQNPSPFFHPVGVQLVFCLSKGASGFTLLSGQDAQAAAQQLQMQMREIGSPDAFRTKK